MIGNWYIYHSETADKLKNRVDSLEYTKTMYSKSKNQGGKKDTLDRCVREYTWNL